MPQWVRSYRKETFANGWVREFDPWLRWHIEPPFFEVSLRGDYGLGAMRGFTIGHWSRRRTRWFTVGGWTFYVHLGACAPHNPHTGKTFDPPPGHP